LVRAVRSCLLPDQSVEVIVVDDGSTENIQVSLEAAFPADLHAGILRFCKQSNQGACVARNVGLAQATGEFIKFLDSDDEFIAGSLPEEIAAARAAGCDALLTGWEERTCQADGSEDRSLRRTRTTPDLSRGIDDMLEGIAPIIGGALYRADFIRPLRWDPAWTKAGDWAWALIVCLAGARFTSLPRASMIYWQHTENRISTHGDPPLRSTRARQQLLKMVEEELRKQDQLLDSRKRQLAQYYYRDCQMLARHDPEEWTRLWAHCETLVPGFRPRDPNRVMSLLTRLLGVHRGVRTYVRLKDVLLPGRKS
jgi:glycosyltransferase involved in cell wall biosynthesis